MPLTREQLALGVRYEPGLEVGLRDAGASENKLLPIHRWVPWIAGFSADFVKDVIDAYLPKSGRTRPLVLDPFAGVGTTLVEAVKAGHDAVGYEINPFAVLAASAKLKGVEVDPEHLRPEVEAFRSALDRFESDVDSRWLEGGEAALSELAHPLKSLRPAAFRSRIAFFSPPVELKFLYALQRTSVLLEPDRTLFRAALGATMVSFSNYSYEPSLGSRPGSGKALIDNTSVATPVCTKLRQMLTDIEWARQNYLYNWITRRREVIPTSYFESRLPGRSVSLVVTSPPYMNNYHYVRNTRPQLHWLGLLGGHDGTRHFEDNSFGKFWQTVRQGERIDLDFDDPHVAARIDELRSTNAERGYYGGAGWANYVATYLNDSNRFVKMLRSQLRSGGVAVVVIGNSIIQGIEFKTDFLLANIAEQHGLSVLDVRTVRSKRVGNSIVDSSVRNGNGNGHREKTPLYDAAVILRK